MWSQKSFLPEPIPLITDYVDLAAPTAAVATSSSTTMNTNTTFAVHLHQLMDWVLQLIKSYELGVSMATAAVMNNRKYSDNIDSSKS